MDIASTLSQMPAPAVYAVVAGLGLTEGAFTGIVLPGAVTLVTAGALAAADAISLPVVILLAVFATLAGDTMGYALGRRLGSGLPGSRLGRLVGAKALGRARSVLERGTLALAASRWIGFVRSVVPPIAGASGVPYRRFLPANALGVATYVPSMLLLGYVSYTGADALLARAAEYAPLAAALVLAGGLGAVLGVWSRPPRPVRVR